MATRGNGGLTSHAMTAHLKQDNPFMKWARGRLAAAKHYVLTEPATCSLCAKKATRSVWGVGFCSTHKDEAMAAQKRGRP